MLGQQGCNDRHAKQSPSVFRNILHLAIHRHGVAAACVYGRPCRSVILSQGHTDAEVERAPGVPEKRSRADDECVSNVVCGKGPIRTSTSQDDIPIDAGQGYDTSAA